MWSIKMHANEPVPGVLQYGLNKRVRHPAYVQNRQLSIQLYEQSCESVMHSLQY